MHGGTGNRPAPKIAAYLVVLCDGALSLIAMSQERRGLPPNAVHFTNPDIAKVAEAFGAHGKVCETASEVETAIFRLGPNAGSPLSKRSSIRIRTEFNSLSSDTIAEVAQSPASALARLY